ncbi:MAG TPA: cytochrome c [Polyangiales bacterium]
MQPTFASRFGLFTCLAVLTACATTSKAGPAQPVSARTPALPKREDLPPEAREALTARMLRHGDQMGALSLAVVLLDYEVVRLLVARMVDEPVLGRPVAGDQQSLNAQLPKSFFVHQDEMSNATRALAAAANQTDDAKLVAAYGALANSCVNCHSAYLHDELVLGPELGVPCELNGTCDQEEEPESSGADPDL